MHGGDELKLIELARKLGELELRVSNRNGNHDRKDDIRKLVDSQVRESTHWGVHKKITIATIVTIAAGIGSGVWFAASVSNQITQHSKEIYGINSRLESGGRKFNKLFYTDQELKERLARLEERSKYHSRDIDSNDQRDFADSILDKIKAYIDGKLEPKE